MANSLLTLDTKDDRRELWHLLHRLPPRDRVAFLARQCRAVRATRAGRDGPVPSLRMSPTVEAAYREDGADYRLTNEVYADLLLLAASWGLDLGAAAVELERTVRRPASGKTSPSPPSSRPVFSAARTPCSRC